MTNEVVTGHSSASEQTDKDAEHGSLNPLHLLIVQPTPYCNINCSYCYLDLRDRSNNRRMTADTVQAIANFLRDVPVRDEPLTVCWHAGEPLVVPISFYEHAFQCFATTAGGIPAVKHNIQTNGMLISDEWCDLFKRWSVRISVSLDGPRAIHDAHRVDRSGRGTFDRAMRGIARLREHGVPFSVLSTVTNESLNAADQIWEFYQSCGITRVGFNPEEVDGRNKESSLTSNEHLTAFRKFMSRIAELQEDDSTIRIRELDDMHRLLTAPPRAEVHVDDNRPGSILSIDVDGNLTTFSPELLGQVHSTYGKFSWGNVHVDSWAQLLKNPQFQRANADIIAGIELCREGCPYFSVCGGGCPSSKLAEHNSFVAAETQTCRFHVQAVADVVIEKLEREIGQRR
jgi:uncharacterized protein